MTHTPDTIAHRFASAVTARDVARVVGCFSPDAVYTDLFYGVFTGHVGLRRLFERMFSEGEDHEWTMTRVVGEPSCTIGEWSFAFTVSAAVPASSGRTLRFTGVSVFETRGDLCRAYREHFDRGAALLALGIRPSAVARIVSRRPSVEVTTAALAR